MPDSLADSRRYCRQLARRTGRNFYFTFLTLPRAMFRDMCVLYAFMRVTDDLGDDERLPVEARRQCLQIWRSRLNIAAGKSDSPDGNIAESPSGLRHDDLAYVQGEADAIFPALAELIARRNIPARLLHDVIDGVESDLSPRVIQNFGELEWYCYQVAGAVGLCCIHVWGCEEEAAAQPAIDCGSAFQLTNILRDLQEDAAAGRVYLPLEDLERFGCTAEDLQSGHRSPGFRRLMAFEIRRARDFYRSGARLYEYLERPGRAVLSAMFRIYGGLLDEIERREYDVFSRRVSLSPLRKATLTARSFLWPGLPTGSYRQSSPSPATPLPDPSISISPPGN